MDSEFIEKLQRIKLTTEEGEIIKVRPSQREKIIEECSLSLFGRFLTTKPINWRAAKNLLRNTWKFGSDLRIVDVGNDLVQFKFTMESQVQWVLNNGPWNFDNSLLLLRRWERGMTVNKVTFTHCPLWVQVWGLPFDLFSEEVGQEIGRGLGRVVEVDWKGSNSDQARFLRIRVEIPLDKPLRRGSQIMNPEGDVVWVAFKYERMVSFCFKCGRIGHEAKLCEMPWDEEGQEYQYGEWLKAGFRKPEETQRTRNNQQPRREEAHKEGRESREMPQSMPQQRNSGSRSGEPENQGTDMELIQPLEWGRDVTEGHVTQLQTHEALIKETNKEGAEIQRGNNDKKTEILGEHLFCVPIIEVGNSQCPKPRDMQTINQARDAVTGTKEKKRAETKPNTATWKRVERKEADTGKREERSVAKVGGKREYSDLNQDTEATGKKENKKKKIQDAIQNKFTTAEAASQPRRGQ